MSRSVPRPRLVLTLLLASALGCTSAPEPLERPNFILMMVDTLRADRLHYAGHETIRTPHFDQLQVSSTWFAKAYSTSPWTLPSVASLFTAQLSSTHGVVDFSSDFPTDASTLAQLLGDAGYQTSAWSASRLIVPARGALQGFDHAQLVHHPLREKTKRYPPGSPLRVAPASSLSPRVAVWIRRVRADASGRPFFAYLHYMEPHTPYLCPHERVREIQCRKRAQELNQKLFKRDWDLDPSQRALVGELYDADIERMDRDLGDFLGALSAAGVLDDTWVILVADHGELLGERGYFLHGKALYEPLIHVPLLFRAPDGVGRVVETPVSIIDVAPTIAELAGIERPDSWQGRSLAGALAGEALSNRPVVAELFMHDAWSKHRFAIIDGEDKYLLDMAGGVSRLRVAEDPDEEHPRPARVEDLERILADAGLAVNLRDLERREAAELSDEQRLQLEALGYLSEEP